MDSEVFVAASLLWVDLIVSHHKTSDTLWLALYQLINVNWQKYRQGILPQSQLARESRQKLIPFIVDLLKLFMSIVNEQQRDQQSSPAFRTLEQKIDEFASGIGGIQDII